MNDLENLRKVWGEAVGESATTIPSLNDKSKLIKKLKNFESFQKRINWVKLTVIVVIISSFIVTLYVSGIDSTLVYAGVLLILLSTISFMTFYFRNQFDSARLDYTLDAVHFAKHATAMLKRQNRIFGVPFVLFILAMIVGANLIFSGIGVESTANQRLYLHIIYSVLIAFSGSVGLLIRRMRIRKEVDPLIKELSQIENNEDCK